MSDAKSDAIPAFGLLNPRFAKDSPWHGLAVPITMVIDNDGKIRHRFSERSYQNRPDADVVLEILSKEAGS